MDLTHADEFLLVENDVSTLIARQGDSNYAFMVIENDADYMAVINKMREAGIKVVDYDEFNRIRGRS